MRYSAATLLVWLAGCSCGGSHGREDGGILDVLSADSAGSDAFAVCDPRPPLIGDTCTESESEACAAWARRAAGSMIGYSACRPRVPYCGNGDYCPDIDPPVVCTCAPGLICAEGEICVSDVPGGTRRCAMACASE